MSQKNNVVRIKFESDYCNKVNNFANEMAEKDLTLRVAQYQEASQK